MTCKINPGCNIPAIPAIPDIKKFLVDQAIAQAAKLIPTAQATRIADLVRDIDAEKRTYEATVATYQKAIQQHLQIPCPLPPVRDKSA